LPLAIQISRQLNRVTRSSSCRDYRATKMIIHSRVQVECIKRQPVRTRKPKSEQRINDGERLNRLFVVEIVPVLFVGEVEAGPYYPDLMHTVGCEQSPALELAKRRLDRKVRQQGRVRRKAPGSVELGSFREFSGRITHQTRRLQNSGVGRLLRQN